MLSNNQNEEAYEAYSKAIQLEPSNEGYKQNLKIVEEKIRTSAAAGGFPVWNIMFVLILILGIEANLFFSFFFKGYGKSRQYDVDV